MAAFDKCSVCCGKGNLKCKVCPPCDNCNAVGLVPCSNCSEGQMVCNTCNGTGELKKEGWLFNKREKCPLCRGNKKIRCNICTAVSGRILCTSCKGKRKNLNCSECKGKQEIICQKCQGKGKFESEWFKSLETLPVDRLRFEYEKRQRNLEQLERENEKLQVEIATTFNDSESFTKYCYKLYDDISNVREEIEAIDRVINEKWK